LTRHRTGAGRRSGVIRPDGSGSKTFDTKRDASGFLSETETAKVRGSYVSPHAGRTLFGEHAVRWMESWNTCATTTARDTSVMRTHVLPQWGSWQLAKVDHLAVQTWISDLGERRSPHTVARCYMLTAAVLRSAVRNRLIPVNPAEGVRLPCIRRRDTDERIISRHELRTALLLALPVRHRGIVATAAGTGLRWGEVGCAWTRSTLAGVRSPCSVRWWLPRQPP